MTKTVTIARSDHRVVLSGEETPKADLEVESNLPGEVETTRSTRDSLLGEIGFINLSWGAEVNREQPHKDDPFPMSMPATIANMTVYGREDRTSGSSPELPLEYMYMDHLYVQEEARGMGYGQLLWDCYVALVAFIDGGARGSIGDTGDGDTVVFLRHQGVPEEDITRTDTAAWLGEGMAVWETDGENIVRPAPVSGGYDGG